MQKHGITINHRDLLTATVEEPCPRKCVTNLERRIEFLNETHETTNWWIIGELFEKHTGDKQDLCLCGHSIGQLFVITNDKKVRVQIGSECIKRFMPDGSLSAYKRSLRHPFDCHVCKKKYLSMDSHLKSKAHIAKLEKFSQARKELVSHMVARKLWKYEQSLRVPGVCTICGEVSDMRGHYTSSSHATYALMFKNKLVRVLTDKMAGTRPFFETTTRCRDCPVRFDNNGGANRAILCARCAQASLTTYKCRDCPARLDNSTKSWKPRCSYCYKRYIKGIPFREVPY